MKDASDKVIHNLGFQFGAFRNLLDKCPAASNVPVALLPQYRGKFTLQFASFITQMIRSHPIAAAANPISNETFGFGVFFDFRSRPTSFVMLPTNVTSATNTEHARIFSNMTVATSGEPAVPSIPDSKRGAGTSKSRLSIAATNASRISSLLHSSGASDCQE